jgi:Domain of unknown function (DUF4209)
MMISDILRSFDNPNKKDFLEYDIAAALLSFAPQGKTSDDEELRAEIIAFDLHENRQDQESGWGTYYGFEVRENQDGTSIAPPSINLITPNMVNYWKKRSNETINPILKSRYSGLVWDFSKDVGITPDHQIARLHIKALVEVANGGFYKDDPFTFIKLNRALTLAISLIDNELMIKVKDAILAFEERHAVDVMRGSWGYAFDLLMGNKKASLTKSEEEKIICDLENRLRRLITSDTEKHESVLRAAEEAAKRLAVYYRKKQRCEDVRRVILEIGNAYDKIITGKPALQICQWLARIQKLYLEFNLKEESDEILIRLRESGRKITFEVVSLPYRYDVSVKMEESINFMTDGDPEDVIFKIARAYIPEKDQIKDAVFKYSKKFPLHSLFSKIDYDDKGRMTSEIGSFADDPEGHTVKAMCLILQTSASFLRKIISEAINKRCLNTFETLSFIMATPVIDKKRTEIIKKGLEAYFKGDYLVFMHLSIPQIEEAIRNTVEISRGVVLRNSRSGGGYDLKILDEILRGDVVKKYLGEDFAYYFRVLFTDQRGWNLRNFVCHGLKDPDFFNPHTADRVFHALICLGLIQKI